MADKERSNIQTLQIRRGPRRVAVGIGAAASAAFRKHGFSRPEILTQWPLIVGETLARDTMPERLRFPRGRGEGAILRVRVDGALGIELQHLEPLVLERINVFYGHRAVEKLQLVQGPLPRRWRARAAPVRPLTPDEEQALAAFLDRIGDTQLKSALATLGRAVIGYIG